MEHIELPRLRPYARQGKAYVDELRAYLKEIQFQVKEDVRGLHRQNKKVTVRFACELALKYELNLKAMFDFLEDEKIIAYGTYDSLKGRGLRPMTMLRQVWAEMQATNQPKGD